VVSKEAEVAALRIDGSFVVKRAVFEREDQVIGEAIVRGQLD